jgi:hypothetical protein
MKKNLKSENMKQKNYIYSKMKKWKSKIESKQKLYIYI